MRIETFELERWMTTYETEVDFDIAESGIYPLTVQELLDLAPEPERAALLDELLGTRLGYSEARGSQALREALAATYRATSPDEILVTTGAIEANFVLFNVLLHPGDHVIAIHPAYQQLYSVPRAIGCEVDLWRLTPDNGFRFDLGELERLLRPTTRLVVINSPHNPTGAMLEPAELTQIYRWVEERDGWLLADEAYRWLELPGSAPLAPPARDLGSRAVSVGTFSKPFGLPGLRIGWCAAPEEIIAAGWAMRDFITLSPGKLNDLLALHALRRREAIAARTRSIVERNLATARAWFADRHALVRWREPRGGLLALLNYGLDMPSLVLANRLAEEYSVMLAPGSAFGLEYHLRLGIGQRPDVFAAGLERFGACLADLRAAGIGARAGWE
jgi:aspartate/methionine/tyrosine aminotransferase